MTPFELGRWALVGSEPAARFLLERWRLRADFPLVAVCDPHAVSSVPDRPFGLPVVSDWQNLLADPHLTGVILAVSQESKPAMIRAALSSGKRVLVEGSPGPAEHAAHAGAVGVFHVRRADRDFQSALVAVTSGRLGMLRTVRWISCEYSLPAGVGHEDVRPTWTKSLCQTGPYLFDQLALIVGASPFKVEAWSQPETAGFQVRLEYPAGLSVWLDVQRAALCGFQTGWVLEGSTGSYHRGRLVTLAADGELLEEDILAPENGDEDVFSDLRRLAESAQAAQESLDRAIQTCAILEAIQRSVGEQRPVACGR